MPFASFFSDKNSARRTFWFVQGLGLLFFGILAAFAIIFYRERMLAYDSANYALEIEQWRHYCLPHGRWSSVFSQFFPLMALNAGCSLSFFLKLYSVCFILLYYVLFLLCTLVFKNNRAGIILMLTVSLGFRWMFYYAISELFMGMAFSVLLYAVVSDLKKEDSLQRKILLTAVSVFLIYTISFFHQLALFPALFVLLFDGLSQQRWKDKWAIGIFVAAVIWSYIRIRYFSVNDYTRGKILSFATYRGQIPGMFQLESWKYFVEYFTHTVKWLFYVYIVSSVWLLIRRHWLMFLLLNGFSFAYVSLVVLTYYRGESGLMIETYLPPLGLYVALVFISLLWTENRMRLTFYITAFLLFVSLRGIYYAGEKQKQRTDYLRRMTNYGRKLENKKYLVSNHNIPVELIQVQWALPFETALYSAMEGKDSAVTFALVHDMTIIDLIAKNKTGVIGAEWDGAFAFRNDDLIALPDKKYLSVSSSQRDTAFHPELFNTSNVTVRAVQAEAEVPYHEFAFVNVFIKNSSGRKIHSFPDRAEPVRMSYRIYDRSGNLVKCENVYTLLDVDVYGEYEQAVKIASPPDAGDYFLEIDFVTGKDNWWYCGNRIPLHIPGRSIFRFL